MDQNIARVKINGKAFIKLTKSQKGRDFLLLSPPTISGKTKVVSHFTFHVPNSRVTFKVTRMYLNDRDITSTTLNEAKKQPVFTEKVTNKDLDLFYNQKKEFIENFQKLCQIALNLTGGHSVSDYFMESKTKDDKFPKDRIFDILLPEDKEKITLNWFVSKGPNYEIPKILKDNYDKVITIKETDYTGSRIVFLLGIIFSFPITNKINRST